MFNPYMNRAIELAKLAGKNGEVPVGAVIVQKKQIIAEGYNRREMDRNSLYHAEILAINEACKKLGGWRLQECDIYVTLEPCPMCAGAIINSRLRRVFFGAHDNKAGSCGSVINLFALDYNHKPDLIAGMMEVECTSLLSDFFRSIR